MKKMLVLVCAILVSVVMTGCVTRMPEGFFVSEYTIPLSLGDSASYSKTGVSTARSVLGILAQGDASIEAACKAGGIKKIHHVDWKVEGVLFVTNYTCIVYGEP